MKISILLWMLIFIFPTSCQLKNTPQKQEKNLEEKIEIIDFDFWENCETGEGTCEPLFFIRNKNIKKWKLQTPCAGTFTNVILFHNKTETTVQEIDITYKDCPPVFDLTNLEDGKYTASMLGCGLGGQVEINLKTIP